VDELFILNGDGIDTGEAGDDEAIPVDGAKDAVEEGVFDRNAVEEAHLGFVKRGDAFAVRWDDGGGEADIEGVATEVEEAGVGEEFAEEGEETEVFGGLFGPAGLAFATGVGGEEGVDESAGGGEDLLAGAVEVLAVTVAIVAKVFDEGAEGGGVVGTEPGGFRAGSDIGVGIEENAEESGAGTGNADNENRIRAGRHALP
jgi:hypothetical protein